MCITTIIVSFLVILPRCELVEVIIANDEHLEEGCPGGGAKACCLAFKEQSAPVRMAYPILLKLKPHCRGGKT
jgi:hypothetical protein